MVCPALAGWPWAPPHADAALRPPAPPRPGCGGGRGAGPGPGPAPRSPPGRGCPPGEPPCAQCEPWLRADSREEADGTRCSTSESSRRRERGRAPRLEVPPPHGNTGSKTLLSALRGWLFSDPLNSVVPFDQQAFSDVKCFLPLEGGSSYSALLPVTFPFGGRSVLQDSPPSQHLLLVDWRPLLLCDTFSSRTLGVSWEFNGSRQHTGMRQGLPRNPALGLRTRFCPQHTSVQKRLAHSNCSAFPNSTTIKVRVNLIMVLSFLGSQIALLSGASHKHGSRGIMTEIIWEARITI
ncbi:uncharacterized protein LOC126648725 [Myiozetetes cayanensis]|uniref:uncharacterized protein LOC126648725 n=1 Tax=Myiozetetes cayanensis TaxID=478635 RepID=UPI00215FB822|nr:uncharacterized protein LOC126648725 [Myiozetetes cayanensis]